MRAADTGPESAGHPGALPPHPAGRGSGAGAPPAAGTSRTGGRGRRRAARPGPSFLSRTVFGTAGLLCLALGTSIALSGRDTPVVRIEASGHDPAATAPTTPTAPTAPVGAPTAGDQPLAASPPTRLLIPSLSVDAPWGADTRVVDVHVQRLRAKIGSGRIETVRGFGYKLRRPA